MFTGAINSLIWILILIAIIAVVIAVVRAATRPRAERPVERSVVQQQPVVQQPAPTSGLAPGWYPDQNDPNAMRYYDGRVWTAQTERRA